MKIEFMYSPAYDLMYHILAHMEINNASNLYSEEYINQINQAKAGQFADLTAELAPLTAYYNENFDRLAMINFLPFYCSDACRKAIPGGPIFITLTRWIPPMTA